MGTVDLNFKPSVPVFDANVALGRRHDSRVREDTAAGVLREMDRAGVNRALCYAPHAAGYNSQQGNTLLIELIHGESRLVPQFVCNPAYDDFDSFRRDFTDAAARCIRMLPGLHNYPFRDWVVGPWLQWMSSAGIALWLPSDYRFMGQTHPLVAADVHATIKQFPQLNVVLSEIHYSHVSWALPLLRSLPNVFIEISRLTIADPISRFLQSVDPERILFGSRFPDSAMPVHLYALHQMKLDESTLRAICAGNLLKLLRMA